MTEADSARDRRSAPERRDVGLIDRMVELAVTQARVEAELAATICEFVDLRRAELVADPAGEQGKVVPGEFAVDEVAAALGWSAHRVQTVAARLRRLRRDLPHTAALWRAGRIDGFKAAKLVEAANRLTRPESVTALDDAAADRAASQTPTQLQQWLHRRVARLEPDAAERRHRRAHADRRLTSRMDLDGMGSLWMAAGAADIAAIDTHLNGLARQLGGQDPRTMDQRRADLAVDLLTGHYADPATGAASAAGAAIGVVVPVQSLLGVDDTPGELADRSATVPAAFARDLAARPDTLFYRLLTDERGNLLDVTQLGRFPSNLLGLAVDVRDGTCRWPPCTSPADRCDHDHTIPTPHGPTTASNLGNSCRRHHRAKTHAGFTLDQPTPGVFVWQTPAGRRYYVEPEPLPLGHWPQPTIHDVHTPIEQLIDHTDTDNTGPPIHHTTIHDALGPRAGPEPLLRTEIELIARR